MTVQFDWCKQLIQTSECLQWSDVHWLSALPTDNEDGVRNNDDGRDKAVEPSVETRRRWYTLNIHTNHMKSICNQYCKKVYIVFIINLYLFYENLYNLYKNQMYPRRANYINSTQNQITMHNVSRCTC